MSLLKELKNLEVGEEIHIICVEDQTDDCTKCFFNKSALCRRIKCYSSDRPDGKDVHFKAEVIKTTDDEIIDV